MLRLVYTFAAFGALTLALLPFQAVAVALELPLRRRIPVLYHRAMCAILGVRIREIGARVHEHPLLIVANHSSWLDISVISAIAEALISAIAGTPALSLRRSAAPRDRRRAAGCARRRRRAAPARRRRSWHW